MKALLAFVIALAEASTNGARLVLDPIDIAGLRCPLSTLVKFALSGSDFDFDSPDVRKVAVRNPAEEALYQRTAKDFNDALATLKSASRSEYIAYMRCSKTRLSDQPCLAAEHLDPDFTATIDSLPAILANLLPFSGSHFPEPEYYDAFQDLFRASSRMAKESSLRATAHYLVTLRNFVTLTSQPSQLARDRFLILSEFQEGIRAIAGVTDEEYLMHFRRHVFNSHKAAKIQYSGDEGREVLRILAFSADISKFYPQREQLKCAVVRAEFEKTVNALKSLVLAIRDFQRDKRLMQDSVDAMMVYLMTLRGFVKLTITVSARLMPGVVEFRSAIEAISKMPESVVTGYQDIFSKLLENAALRRVTFMEPLSADMQLLRGFGRIMEKLYPARVKHIPQQLLVRFEAIWQQLQTLNDQTDKARKPAVGSLGDMKDVKLAVKEMKDYLTMLAEFSSDFVRIDGESDLTSSKTCPFQTVIDLDTTHHSVLSTEDIAMLNDALAD